MSLTYPEAHDRVPPLGGIHPGPVAASVSLTMPLTRPPWEHPSCHRWVTPSQVEVEVASLAPRVGSGSALCVRLGKEGRSEEGSGRTSRQAGRLCSRPTTRAGCAWRGEGSRRSACWVT
jgi:hypothetical protein